MVFNLAVKNVFSNWGKNKTIVTILAVSLILIQFLISLSEGFGLQVKTFALDSLVGDLKIINPKSRVDSSIKLNFVIDDSTLDKISKIEGVRGVTTRINIPLVIKSEREFKNVVLVGINTEREKDISFLGKSYNPNNFKEAFKDNGILIGADLLKKLKTKNHFKVVASGQDVNEKLIEKAFFINDVFTTNIPNVSELYIFSDIKEVAKTFGFKQNEVSEVSIALVNQKYMESVKAEIKKILPVNSEIFEWGELMKFLKEWLDMMFINLLVFFSIVFLAASFPLSNTLLISVLERVYQFGILQALGLKILILQF
jgi:ABC-type lipoprotein release transport system permease subunit